MNGQHGVELAQVRELYQVQHISETWYMLFNMNPHACNNGWPPVLDLPEGL